MKTVINDLKKRKTDHSVVKEGFSRIYPLSVKQE